jgi:hypothetical protein
MQFATIAKEALDEAARDLARPSSPQIEPPVSESSNARAPVPPSMTIAPSSDLRPPASPSSPPNATIAPSAALRAPAPGAGAGAGSPAAVTAPPPIVNRPPGINYLDDMITLRPKYEPRAGLAVTKDDDGSVRIEPKPVLPRNEDAVMTRPRMLVDPPDSDPDVTSPNLELPLLAPASSPSIPLPGASLASRIDAQLSAEDAEHTRDVTRQASVEEEGVAENKSLRHEARDKSHDATRRVPYPTAEVDEQDIEAAIELAPPARRTVIGVAKKPTKE